MITTSSTIAPRWINAPCGPARDWGGDDASAATQRRNPPAAAAWIGGLAVAAALFWSYWPVLAGLWRDWRNDDYSVCAYVLPVALFLVWRDRSALRSAKTRVCGWGLLIILLAELARTFGLVFLFESAQRYAFVLTVAGLLLFIAGRDIFWRLKWHLAFLLLMVPLPGQVHNLISGPLRSWATGGAVVALELLGVVVTRDGNLIVLNHDTPLAVAEACSGLRMLTAFVFTAALMAFLVQRPPWQRAALVLTSVPIALACNLIRLTATGLLFLAASGELAARFFHDFAGLTMMPMAIAFLLLELWIMDRLVITDEPPQTTPPAVLTARVEHQARAADTGQT